MRIKALALGLMLISILALATATATHSRTLFYQVIKQKTWDLSGCTLKVQLQEKPTAIFCGGLCRTRIGCSFYCVKKSSCVLYNARINFNRNPLADPGSGSSQGCFSSWGHEKDIAHTANITASIPWFLETNGQAAVSGFYCYKYEEGCFTSTRLFDPFWKADLGESVSLQKIVVQTMRDYPDEFWHVEVRVGDSVNMTSNDLVDLYEDSAPQGSVVTFKFDTPVVGRYVSLESIGFGYLGICDIQIITD